MPRRNLNAVQSRTRVARPTHLLMHIPTGKSYGFGTKQEMLARADLNNSVEAVQNWTTAPIHK